MQYTQPVTTTQVKLAAKKDELENVNASQRSIFANVAAARLYLAGLRQKCIAFSLLSSQDGHVGRAHHTVVSHIMHQVAELGSAEVFVGCVEGSQEYAAAKSVIEPIEAEIEKLTELDLKERQTFSDKANTHRTALENARAKALADAEKHPDVLAAAKALAL